MVAKVKMVVFHKQFFNLPKKQFVSFMNPCFLLQFIEYLEAQNVGFCFSDLNFGGVGFFVGVGVSVELFCLLLNIESLELAVEFFFEIVNFE